EVRRSHARDPGDAGGIEAGQHLALQAGESERLEGEVAAIAQAVAHKDVHDTESEGGVGAQLDPEMPVRALRGTAAARLDDHELRAAIARALDERPDVDVGGEQIGAPRDDEIGLGHRLGISAAHAPARRVPSGFRGGITDGARLEACGAEGVKESQEQSPVELPLMRAVRIPEETEGAVAAQAALPSRDDLIQGLAPADRLEAPLALGAHAPEGREHALGRVHPLVLAIDLGAGEAGRHRMLRVALDLYDAPILDGGEERALIGAIMGAGRTDRLNHELSFARRIVREGLCLVNPRALALQWPPRCFKKGGPNGW